MGTGTVPGWYEGRCKDCAEPAVEGAARCEACRTAHNAAEAKRRAARKKAGLCRVCGAKAVVANGEPLSTCKKHRAYYAARARGTEQA